MPCDVGLITGRETPEWKGEYKAGREKNDAAFVLWKKRHHILYTADVIIAT
jgi:hypothetical protein